MPVPLLDVTEPTRRCPISRFMCWQAWGCSSDRTRGRRQAPCRVAAPAMTSAAIQIHGHRRRRVAVFVFIAFAFGTAMGYAQSADDPQSTLAIPSSNLRVRFDMLGAGYWDYNQAPLGHESQGRIGWAIIGLSGEINPYISFAAELNPVNDSARPQPACGETNYFYPNVPSWPGPQVACVPDGRNRVDLYRFVGLDPLTQQNSVRVAVIDVHRQSGTFGAQAGRFVLPIGFGWRELGSWTNEDAPLIQRLNADASFGALVYAQFRRQDEPLARLEAAIVRGDGNRNVEYSYSAFIAPDEDTNSGATTVVRVMLTPMRGLDVRFSGKYGFSGSKVEIYPSFYLSKRNDTAAIGSIQYRPNRYVRGFGEYARYVSGLPDSSAELIGIAAASVIKRGYYVGGEATAPLPKGWEASVSLTGEDISRNDSLVWYMEALGLYGVHLGARVRSTIVRVSVKPTRGVEFGGYWNRQRNPYPWLSGIVPVAGDNAFTNRADRPRYGFVFRLQVP